MASGQKKKKTTKTQRNKANSTRQRRIREKGLVQDEIILVVTLVISVLLFLSYFDLSGKVGKFVSGIVFGMIGLEAYIMPFVIFLGMAFHLSNLGNKRAGRKLLSANVFFVALAALIQMITYQNNNTIMVFDFYMNSSKARNGGGLIGGIFAKLLSMLFDDLATFIILIAVMMISLTVITGKAIFTYIAKKSKASLEERMEYQRLKKEQQEAMLANSPETGGRRPPKTFLLDPETSGKENRDKDVDKIVSLKEKRLKKGQTVNEEELPIINLDHLFNEDGDVIKAENLQKPPVTDPMMNQAVPTYEEELHNKFGKAQTEGQAEPIEPIEIVKTAHPTAVEQHNQNHDEIKAKPGNDSTEIEPLDIKQVTEQKKYIFPSLNLLTGPKARAGKAMSDRSLKETAMKLQNTLDSFGVHVTITNVSCGPAVTRYELQPEQGVKVSRITSLADDIKLNLAASDIRIEAPIPGKAAVGIEVPNTENSVVTLREMLESKEFTGHPSDIAFAVGKDIGGQTIITDIAKMPHLLIAGATGSGKSVCINTLIMSILYKSSPSDVRMIMIDPKVVELNVYNGIPHLLIPVVTDPKKASAALNWAVMEMTERYKKFADAGVRDLKGYNEKVSEVAYLNDESCQKLPQILIIIDELADLMMVAPGEVEDAICRLAQLARAAGLHLIIATQRPSVNVITGLIKANIPSRIAFAVSSQIDSRTIIDGSGAEKLLGKGDMLFFPSGYPKPVRVQGAYVSDKEVSTVVDYVKKNNNEAQYSDEIKEKITNAKVGEGTAAGGGSNDIDEYFSEAGKFIIDKDKASIGMLQRVYKIGFNRAARIMDQLAEAGVVGPEEGTKPRKILMSLEQFEQYLEEN